MKFYNGIKSAVRLKLLVQPMVIILVQLHMECHIKILKTAFFQNRLLCSFPVIFVCRIIRITIRLKFETRIFTHPYQLYAIYLEGYCKIGSKGRPNFSRCKDGGAMVLQFSQEVYVEAQKRVLKLDSSLNESCNVTNTISHKVDRNLDNCLPVRYTFLHTHRHKK